MVVPSFNPSTQEAEAGESVNSRPVWSSERAPGQPGVITQRNPISKKKYSQIDPGMYLLQFYDSNFLVLCLHEEILEGRNSPTTGFTGTEKMRKQATTVQWAEIWTTHSPCSFSKSLLILSSRLWAEDACLFSSCPHPNNHTETILITILLGPLA